MASAMLPIRICAAYIVRARPPSLTTSRPAVIGSVRLPTSRPSDHPARNTNSSAESESERLRCVRRSYQIPGMWLTKIETRANPRQKSTALAWRGIANLELEHWLARICGRSRSRTETRAPLPYLESQDGKPAAGLSVPAMLCRAAAPALARGALRLRRHQLGCVNKARDQGVGNGVLAGHGQ